MRLIRSVANLVRDIQGTLAVLSLPREQRRLVVYSEDTHSYNMFQGYLETLMSRYGRSVVYITSAPDDPLLTEHHEKMAVYYISRALSYVVPKVDSSIFMTTMPDLGKLHVDRPPPETCCLYVFHSLNSIHEVYRPGAFDHFDAFFCAGPHHTQELEAYFKINGKPLPALHKVGYYKIDRVIEAYAAYKKQRTDAKTVLVAPSWGPNNLLTSCGIPLVERLLAMDVRVIVRPHPCFFLPVYPDGRRVVEALARRFDSHTNFLIERQIDSEDSFYEADLMISDFSGAAWEYALGTLRPVLFIDVPRKTFNPDWKKLGLSTFEDKMRYEVGRVIALDEMSRVDSIVGGMLQDESSWTERLQEIREKHIYNPGHSVEVGAEIIDEMLG